MSEDLVTIIRNALPQWRRGNEKQGRSKVQPAVARALQAAGYHVDLEDKCCFLQARMPIWQEYSTGAVCYPAKRLKIDLVVYDPSNTSAIALVEIESDLANMGNKAGYAVESIACDARGRHFDSYNSVERMAAAAQYRAMAKASGDRYPTPHEGVKCLKAICSDFPAEYNPADLGLFLFPIALSQGRSNCYSDD